MTFTVVEFLVHAESLKLNRLKCENWASCQVLLIFAYCICQVHNHFCLLKRGLNGIFHHVSQQSLDRYFGEFQFRYNARKIKDGERAIKAMKGAEGKRLVYKDAIKKK